MIGISRLVAACFAALFFLTNAPGSASSAEGEEAPGQKAGGVDPHAAHVRFHFDDLEMDFVFGSLVLGSAAGGGCEIGEAYVTAARIKDGDASSWQREWLKTAELAEARGRASLERGHQVSARDQLLRASHYCLTALISMPGDDPRYKPTALHLRELFKRAGALLDPPVEYFEIAFEGKKLPGYFRKAAQGASPAKTLLMIGGAETYAEHQFYYIARQAFERGYNFMTLDLPGQGMTPLDGLIFRPAMDAPVKAAVDYALARADVDPKRLAVYGISSGGGFAPQAAERDGRIGALVMNNCVVDAEPGVAKMAVATATPEVTAAWSSFKRQSNQAIAWRFGVAPDNLPGLVAANRGLAFDPAKVAMPALIVVASGEAKNPEIARQTKLCFDCLASARKAVVISPAEEGASNHCIMENRSLMSQVVFDWLDETFK